MSFFEYFPKEYYNLDKNKSSLDIITNITRRFMINESVKTNSSAFYEYVVSDGETPEQISYKIYGDSTKHWIILMLNDIVDPQYDWPMDENSLNKFIEKKYETQANGSPVLSWSQSNVRGYFKAQKRTDIRTNYFRREVLEVDANTYANVVTSTSNITLESGDVIVYETDKFTESYYEYEKRINDQKRRIKLLKNDFVTAIVRELEEIFEQ